MTQLGKKEAKQLMVNYTGIDKNLRTKRGWSLDYLVQRCHGLICKRTIQAYENGTSEATASNLMLLSDAFHVPIDVLLRRNVNPVLFFENKKIPRYIKVKDHYERNSKSGYYHIDENIEDSTELGALKLDEDSLVLQLPKGTTLLVDTSPSSFIINEDTRIRCMINVDGEIFPTSLNHTPMPRHKMLFTYMDKKNFPNLVSKREIDEKEMIIGVIKKAIIDY